MTLNENAASKTLRVDFMAASLKFLRTYTHGPKITHEIQLFCSSSCFPEHSSMREQAKWPGQKQRLIAHFSGNPIVVIGDFDDHRNSDLQSFETPHEKMHFGGAPLCG
jgi:hypothetical protein